MERCVSGESFLYNMIVPRTFLEREIIMNFYLKRLIVPIKLMERCVSVETFLDNMIVPRTFLEHEYIYKF